MPRPGSRLDSRNAAFALLGLAMAASAVLVLYWSRGRTFSSDELVYATRLSQQSLWHAMVHPPSNSYLIALPMVVYKAMFEAVGMASYVPYRLAAVALNLLCAGLFFVLARRRIGDFWALAPTILLLLFGYGAEEILTAARLPGSISLAAGLGMFLALSRATRRGDIAAALLLTVAVLSHPLGLAFVAAAAVMVLSRPPAVRWRSSWIVAVPAFLFAGWWLVLRAEATVPMQSDPGEIASFVRQSWTATIEALSGVAGVVSDPIYDASLGWIVSGLALALIAVVVARTARRPPPSFWAATAALLTLMITTGITRGNAILMHGRPADADRYLYPQAFLLLLVLVELAGAARPSNRVKAVAVIVLALGLIANLNQLSDAGQRGRVLATQLRAGYGAIEGAEGAVSGDYAPNGFLFPNAGDYFAFTHDFGSFGFSTDQLESAPVSRRVRADQVLLGGLGIAARPAQAGPAVRCIELHPPVRANLVVSSGSVFLRGEDLRNVELRIGRFSQDPSGSIPVPAGGRSWRLAIPTVDTPLPWRLAVESPSAVSLCGTTRPSPVTVPSGS
jgi:hypothetical protein